MGEDTGRWGGGTNACRWNQVVDRVELRHMGESSEGATANRLYEVMDRVGSRQGGWGDCRLYVYEGELG